ncbi:rCG42225 [Rattus norvegicus]|uniref:RCG42225 n=1 Tax=Rattus norvegicus TaxID=10116 RepID=A6K048_RAT|nr:rCG42225 [Rattus norvegicus]
MEKSRHHPCCRETFWWWRCRGVSHSPVSNPCSEGELYKLRGVSSL